VTCLDLLANDLLTVLEVVHLASRRKMFLNISMPPHFSNPVANFLTFLNCGVGCNGLLLWPCHSPDLSPADFFLWSTLI